MRKWLVMTLVVIACALALGAPGPAAAQSGARRGAAITLNPTAGQAGTQVQITGTSFSSFCAGYILIDDQNTGVQFHCNNDSSFQVTITWPDGLADGNHLVTANSIFGATSAPFRQIPPVATPVPTDTPSATGTPSAGGVAGGGNPTPPASQTNSPYYSNWPAVLALGGLCCSVLVLGAGMTVLILMLRRRDRRSGLGMSAEYVPPPPPPPDVPPDPENPWVWPNDPFGR